MPVSTRLWNNPVLLEWAMLFVVAAGVAFCCWARFHLGRLWSASVLRKEGHRIVDTGPYRLVRPPIYTGFIVIYVGLGVLCANGMAVAALTLLTLGLRLKARVEEQFLVDELAGEAYGDYKARTPMLVPSLPRRA
jgi:protein-S-isoprenylcysteine O-methyltransferase Ste14